MTASEVERDARDHTMRELIGRLSHESSVLLAQELELAKTEVAQHGASAGAGAALVGIGGAFGLLGFAAFTAAVILAIALALPSWAAALIVAVAYGLVAGLSALAGGQRVKRAWPLAPQTLQTVKENIAWISRRAKSPTS